MMKKMMNILMLSCKKSSELIEKKLFSKLTLIEKIQLTMHTSMCDVCKSWKKQSEELDHSLKNHFHYHPPKDESKQESLSEEVKQAIIRKVEDQNK